MTCKLRMVGLTAVAALTMAALFAVSASAQMVTTVGSSPAILTGAATGAHTFTLANGGPTIGCNEVGLTSIINNGVLEITVVPSYGKCAATFGSESFKVTITMNDCDYVFDGFFAVATSSTTFDHGQIDLACPVGKKPEIHIYKDEKEKEELCTYTVGEFINNGGNEFHNVAGSPNDLTITTMAIGIPVTRTGSLLCGPSNATATYTGSTTLKAFEYFGGTVSNGTTSKIVEGAQVSLTVSEWF